MKEDIQKLLEKSSHAIHAAEVLLREGEFDSAAGRAYYAMFYIAEALLYQKGIGSLHKHSAVHSEFGKQFSKTLIFDVKFHRWLIDAFDKRIQGDYNIESFMTEEDVTEMIQQAKEFLIQANQYLAR